jgi:pilus assembly protein CpaB
MDRRFLTVLGVSLVFALVVSSVFYQMTSKAGSSAKKPEVTDLRDVVIAAHPLPVGVSVKAEDIKVIKVPVGQFPNGAFNKVEDVLDRPVVSNILNEEPILEGRLAQRGSGTGLAPTIPTGMRAVSVRVNDIIGVAGWILPGMRVDVLTTGEPLADGNRITKTILQNIVVLSAGAALSTDATGKPVNAPNVTLLVYPQQAEMLTIAGSSGSIQLVLRNGGDQGIETTKGETMSSAYGLASNFPKKNQHGGDGSEPAPRPRPQPVMAAAIPPPPAPVTDQIITIRGIDKKTETVAAKKSE